MASRIRTKLVRIFSLALIPIGVLAIISLYNQRTIHEASKTVNSVSAEFRLLNEMQLALERSLMPSNDYIITGNGAYKKEFDSGAVEMERLIRDAWVVLDSLELELDPERVAEEKLILSSVIKSWSHIKDISIRIFSIPAPVGSAEAARLMEEMDYKWGFPAIEALGRWHRIDQAEYNDAVRSSEGAWFRAWIIMAGGLAFTAVFAVGIGYYYSGVFVRPIERLREHSVRVASGDFASRAGLRTGDEIEELSEAMDRMSSELSALYGGLELKVEERTAELKEKEELYRSLFNGTNDAIFVHPVPGGDDPLKFIDVNDAACRRLGYTREEMLKLSPYCIDAPGHEAAQRAAVKDIAGKGHAIFEMVHVAKDGREIPVEVSTRVFELRGALMCLSIARDITERKTAEEALRESEEKYRTMIQNANDLIWTVGEDGVFTFVNQRCADLFGYGAGEMIGSHFRSFVFEEDIELAENYFSLSMRGERLSVQVRARRADGEPLHLFINTAPVVSGGKVAETVCFARDITEQKRAEEKASREKRLNESIVNNMPAGVAFLDNGFVLRKFNASYAETIRKYSPYTPEEALGLSYFDYVPGSRAQVEEWFQGVRDTGVSSSRQGFELKLSGVEESVTYWDTSVTPVFDETGKVEGILLLTQDITERKTGENALRERVEELEMFRKLTLKRELRLRELKDRIEVLEKELKGARA